jgi:hypothetical protein
MVEGYAMGRSPDELAAEMLRALGEQAAASTSSSETAHLRLVDDRDTSTTNPDREARS